MEKLKMESVNLTEQNIEKIGKLFPNVITETKDENGKLKKSINFGLLQQVLSEDLIDGDESYEFTWVGKKQSIIDGNKPIRKTLRPCVEESKDWDTTENLYIEGDNLDVLKLLQNSYLNSIKLIYIDPPYNTGKDFVYRDRFKVTKEDYEDEIGLFDEEENRLFQNNESNGRFHSDWCSMMYPRLQLSRNLLEDSGVIFISIDDHELENIRKICNEVFGEGNFIGVIANINNPKGRSDDKFIATAHEYIVVYAKNRNDAIVYGFEPDSIITNRYNKTDKNGKPYREMDLRKTGDADKRSDRPDMFYYFYFNPKNEETLIPSKVKLVDDNLIEILPLKDDNSEGRWRWGFNTSLNNLDQIYPKFMPTRKIWGVFEKDYLEGRPPVKCTSSWTFKDVNSERGSEQMIELGFDKETFSRPKPIGTLRRVVEIGTVPMKKSTILDFFSGSSGMAQAIFELLVEDKRNLNFIMVQLPEECDLKSQAYIEGFKTITEIGKERIRRAGDKIKKESGLMGQNLDVGFRVLKLDDTNMKDVYYGSGEYSQQMLLGLESNIKEDRTDLDLLYGVMLEWGVPLSLPHKQEKMGGKTVHFVNGSDLVGCFDENINETVIRDIAKQKPLRVVFRDSSFSNSPDKINVTEIFKTISPETTIKVI